MTEPPPRPQKSRILIVGNAGQLGRELEKIFAGYRPHRRRRSRIRRSGRCGADPRARSPRRARRDSEAAAYTAVDRAESERDLAYAINEQAPRVLAEEAHRRDALFVHYSTDYVFNGGKSKQSTPWTETDAPNPLNVYGASKLAGEQAIKNSGGQFSSFAPVGSTGLTATTFCSPCCVWPASATVSPSLTTSSARPPRRSSWPAPRTRSSPAFLPAASEQPKDWTGLYHMTCGGSVSWFGFAQAIFARAAERLAIKPPELTPIPTTEYPTPATRPRNSVLSNARLHARFGVELPPWESALEETLQVLRNAG